MVLPANTCIIRDLIIVLILCQVRASAHFLNLTLPHQHPNPEYVVNEVGFKVNNASTFRRQILQGDGFSTCLTGNPIDDCWRCDPNWAANRQRLADCAIGFGAAALGGKGGQFYVVTDSSDQDVANPRPGTLRYGVIQEEPLWIIFSSNMMIKLRHELIINSRKTIDGRGYNIHITGNGCLTLQYISNVIIHNIHIHHCKPSGNTIIRSTPTHAGFRGVSDGDGISISGSRNIWIDHCSLSYCTDGLIDAILGSTAITISNSYFTHHNEVIRGVNEPSVRELLASALGQSSVKARLDNKQAELEHGFSARLINKPNMSRWVLGSIMLVNSSFTCSIKARLYARLGLIYILD